VSGNGAGNGNGDGSSLDEVPEEDVEELEESVDTESLDEEELVSLDDAARSLLAREPKGHGPSRPPLPRRDAVRLRRQAQDLVQHLVGHHRPRDHLDRSCAEG
jgi:hypothetical protein